MSSPHKKKTRSATFLRKKSTEHPDTSKILASPSSAVVVEDREDHLDSPEVKKKKKKEKKKPVRAEGRCQKSLGRKWSNEATIPAVVSACCAGARPFLGIATITLARVCSPPPTSKDRVFCSSKSHHIDSQAAAGRRMATMKQLGTNNMCRSNGSLFVSVIL